MGYLQIHGIPQSFYDDMERVYVNSDKVYENNEVVFDDDVELDGHEVKQEQLHMDHGHGVHTQGQQLPLTHEEVVVEGEPLEFVSKLEQCHHSHNHKCNQHSHNHSHSHQQHR